MHSTTLRLSLAATVPVAVDALSFGSVRAQVIGETSTGDMLNVNPTKSKELTNFRNKGKEDHIVLQVRDACDLECPPIARRRRRGYSY
eukprot:COSAG06_NODE_20073_length_809_cov_2328.954930_1_plen_88_part_00